jgi:S1-C subfamily serine protease/uncharacterized RDD family membrane protein YckC
MRKDEYGRDGMAPGPGAPAATPVHPWARFWARSVDLVLFYALVVLAVPGWHGWAQVPARLLASILTPLAWTIPEALLLSSLRTTPGKWALGLRVESADGERLEFGAAWKRAVQVWLRGLGAGIPILNLVAMGRAYLVLVREGRSTWDAEEGTRVAARAWSRPARAGAALGAVGAASALFAYAALDLPTEDALEREATEALADHRHETEHWAGKSGATLAPLSDVRRGALAVEESESFRFQLEEGEEAIVLAACDLDCYDLDVAVLSPAGDTVAFDDAVDAWPFVEFEAPETGEYVAAVILYECDVEPCWYAAQAFRSTRTGPWTSTGTCFAVSGDGLLVTARHVVADASQVRVTFADGRSGTARVVAEDVGHDLAVLRTSVVPRDVLGLAGPDAARLGAQVFTIGFPATDILGTDAKYTEGAIASLSGLEGNEDLLQVSVPIQPGNSGGPLVDERGEVLGVINATATPREFELETGTFPQNVNWATKIEHVGSLLPRDLAASEPAATREDAVDRAFGAVCYLEAEGE